jgi:di/tricarboxylate transporter
MITFDLVLVCAVLLFILISLCWKLLGVSFTFMIGVITLGVFGVLTPTEIIKGFGNEHVAVVILMLLFSDVIRKTDIIEYIFDRLFHKTKTYRGFISRMIIGISGLSMFMNNAPLIAVMMPYINNWAKRKAHSPSKFLLPLSYAAILGGAATLIGTSTNLIVNSMITNQTIIPNLKSLNMFEFAWVGIPMIIIGGIYLALFSNLLLPDKAGVVDEYSPGAREYVIEAKVRLKSHLIGKTIGESGLLDIKGLFLAAIIRKSFRITEVPADVILDGNDILVFTGNTKNIADLIRDKSGLILPEVGMLTHVKHANVVEVVVSQNSALINKTVRDSDFRGKYDAAIISLHRNGEKIETKLGNVVLKSGDVLLLFAGDNFISRSGNSNDFYFISMVSEYLKLDWYRAIALVGGMLLVITLSALNVISLFMGLIIMILFSMAFKVTNPKDIPNNIDYNLALVIVVSLAFGTAMMKSGTSDLLANGLISLFLPLGKTGVLFGIYMITALLSAYITTKGAIAVIFPVALSVAQHLGLPGAPFVLTVAYAAACTFITPHGYVTNLMVYGPGGYSHRDFIRFGLPLTVIYMIVAVLVLSFVYF